MNFGVKIFVSVLAVSLLFPFSRLNAAEAASPENGNGKFPIRRKTSNVSYSLNPVRKTLAVPLLTENFRFGTGMQDPIWKKAATVSDFVTVFKDTAPSGKNRLSVFRTEKDLFLGLFTEVSEKDRLKPPPNAVSAWEGDLVELLFGGMEPDPWLMQLAVGITGIRFDSSGRSDLWEARTFETAEGWGMEVRLPLNRLRLTEGGVAFDLCRYRMKSGEGVAWSRFHKRCLEVENYGEFLFGSYSEIAHLRTGLNFKKDLTRQEFETLRNQWETPANLTTHGPFLSFPEGDKVSVTWETAGRVPGFVEFRKKGTAAIRHVTCDREGGILKSETLHSARLTGLAPDTEYEYRLCTLLPVVNTFSREAQWRTFRTMPAHPETFSFFTFSDLHSNAAFLRQALKIPEADRALLHVSLGDNLSHASGLESLFEGFLDPLVEADARRGRAIPLLFANGNHEQIGAFASESFRVMRHPSGKTWYTLRVGGVFFIVLDSGTNGPDFPKRPPYCNVEMRRAETEFLKEITVSPEYKNARYRIVLVHIPPLARYSAIARMLQPLQTAEVRPDLMFCGHMHKFARINGSTGKITSPEPEGSQWAADLRSLPFPVLILSTNTVVNCEFSPDGLQVKVLKPGKDGAFVVSDEFCL